MFSQSFLFFISFSQFVVLLESALCIVYFAVLHVIFSFFLFLFLEIVDPGSFGPVTVGRHPIQCVGQERKWRVNNPNFAIHPLRLSIRFAPEQLRIFAHIDIVVNFFGFSKQIGL